MKKETETLSQLSKIMHFFSVAVQILLHTKTHTTGAIFDFVSDECAV